MPQKSADPKTRRAAFDPAMPFAALAPAAWMSTAWFENLADLGSELTSFVADRIQEDVKTQHALMHCTTLPEVQQVQAEFLQRAFDQYQAETGKLIAMTGRMAVDPNAGSRGDG